MHDPRMTTEQLIKHLQKLGRLSKGEIKMKLTREEVKRGLEKMAENNLAKRQAIGIEGDNPEYVILVNALALLG